MLTRPRNHGNPQVNTRQVPLASTNFAVAMYSRPQIATTAEIKTFQGWGNSGASVATWPHHSLPHMVKGTEMVGNVTRMKSQMGAMILSAALVGAIGLLTGCESIEGLNLADSRSPSGGAWPGGDQASYDAMATGTRCRPTLGQVDCVTIVQPPPAVPGQPQALVPAGVVSP